ncbi:PLxRFG domain-containing protein [Desulfovibrio piger]|nr:PLxRFG domain-containing protein [Desulfovibrio piger]
MSRESNRPTKTNYQDYLFDFSDVDFSQGAARPAEPAATGQATPTQERGFLERLGYSALAIGEGLPMLPGRMADTIRDAWNGGDIDVTDTEALQEREQRAREQAAYAQKYQGKAFDGVTDAMISMPYSLTTLAAGIGASVPATLAAGPVAGGAAAMAASGGVAYRASKQEFMENMLEETSRVLGRRPTQEEWDRIAADFDSEATQYGLWEAGPEALGNLFFTKLLGPLGKGFLTDGLGKAVKRGIGLYGGEMGTEAATQMGQGHIAAEMGWRDEAPGPLQALKEIAPATFWQTTLMAGGKKGLDLLAQRYQERAGQKGMAAGISGLSSPASPPTVAPESPETYERDFASTLRSPEWNAPDMPLDQESWNREARARGWNHLVEEDSPASSETTTAGMAAGIGGLSSPVSPQTPTVAPENPEIYERDFASTLRSPEWNAPDVPPDRESWNREARARGWNHLVEDDLAASPETTTAAPGLQPSLDNGEHIDLLRDSPAPENGPSPSMPSTAGMAAGIGGLDPLRASPAADTLQETPLAAHGTPEIPAPPAPLPPLPGVASGIGGLPFSPAQPAPRQPVQIPSLPTQAQLTRTQEKPRADTTAAAEQLGIPGPDAVPQEAQRPELSPAMPQQTLPNEAQAPTVSSPLPAPAMQPTPLPESPQAAPQQPDSLPTSARQPETSPVLPPAEPVVIPPELAGLSRKELIRRLPRQLRGKADFMGTEEMRSLLARRLARTQATGPERSGAQPDTAEEKTPLTYGGKPLSHPPIGDARRENTADAILAGAAERAKAEGRQEMLAAVEDMQRERKSVGVTHDALWQRITDEMLPYASEAGQEEAARTGAAPAQDRESKKQEAPEAVFRVTSDADRPVEKTPDAEESVSPDSLKGKTADAPGAERPEDGISSSGQSPESEQKAERPQIRIRNLVSGKEEYLDIAESPRRNTDDEAARRTDTDRGAATSPAGAFGTIDAPDTVALAAHFSETFLSGKKFGAIIEARREAGSLLGGTVRPATEAAKAVDEAVELGVTLAARRTVAAMRERHAGDTDIYRALVDLYQRQPRLNVRTSTSIAQQAYSTPAPIAFLASRLAGIDSGTRVFEPTAGNGMLLLEASPDRAAVNELNPDRASRLRSQGFEVTERDAVDFRPEDPVDVVIANPPFGRVKGADRQTREFSVNGLTTKELDHAIVARALESLKQGGRAVLIIGGKQGNDAGRSKKYRAADQVRFWGWLFERYRVLEHFCVDGKLYERQGAGYPIDVVVLENSGTSAGRPFPGAALPRVYTSFNALEEVLHGQVVDTAERKSGSDGTDTGRTGDGANQQRGRSDRPADAAGSEADRGSVRSGGNAGADGARSGERLDSGLRNDRPATAGGSRLQRSERPAPESGNDVSADAEGGRTGGERQADVAADSQRGNAGKRGGRDDAGRLGQHRDGGDVRSELGVTPPQQSDDRPRTADRPKSTVFQVAYEPASAMQGMGTLVPRNMATAARQAMTALEKRHGSIDRYVAGQLGYPEKDLGKYFAAEQVDALGMAISNIADGSGFIIGDQTGIGKGRVNAGIIRWAKRQGYIPVFVTMKPDLYADMVRDLADIGMEGFNPLPTNAELSGDKAILLPDGRTLRTKTAKAHEKVLADVMKNGMGAYDAVFTTYDQLNPVKGQDTFRRQFMMNIAPNAVFILDESHNAGGQANVRKKADAADDRAQFVRKMLQTSHQGAFYSSATYAKRPDVMSLYFKTDMQYAADDMGKLAEAIERGGIPMQQAVAAELTETGQYLRRERSFEGAEVQTSTVPIDKARAEKTAEIMRAIMAFDAVKEAAVERADKEAARRGGSVGDNKSTGKGGASSTNFTAVMHNVIAQSLLAQKVDAVVEAAAEDVARGEKVVIALSNTMGSMIREFAEQNGIAAGSPINFTFNDMFIRYLEKSRMISIREAGKKEATEKRRLTDEELGPDGVRAYNQALAVINKSDFGGLPVSVIDRMLAEFEARGIRADEITGRTERIDYTTDAPTYAKRTTGPSDRIRVVDAFNAGKLDVVILNQAGSTGISLHASERFKDQRRRNMIIAQAESNIDVFMQTLGRVFRTGQVVPPTYQLIMSDLPAEKRPAAVLAKKMASLNANTTASKDSDASFKNIPDFLNKYGDKVAAQVMADNPALALKLGSPVGESSEDAMRKVTGRIPLLPVKEQEKLYALLESEYNDYIAQLEALGGSGLEARSLPLDARLTASEEIVPARDVGKKTPFADAAVLGTYDVKKLGKPWPAAKVREMVSAAEAPDMDGLRKEAEAWHRKKAGEMSAEAAEKQLERLNAAYAVISDAARMQPGTPVTISGNNTMTEGILLRLYRKGSADNPLALSAWKLDIALPDASRRITIPLSQTIRKEDSFTVSESSRNPETLYALFDSGQKESREKVHIITGNILAAFQKINGKGNVITFQDHEGRTIPGILLPRDTDPRKLIEGMDVSLSPDAAMRFLKELPGSAVIKSADKLFSISFNGRHYSVYVPSSKAKGAQFFLNGAVLQAAGKDFVKAGQNMALRELDEAQASGILRALSAQGYGFVADNNRDRARALAAGDGALASLGGRRRQQPAAAPAGQFLPPRQKSPRHTPAAFKAMQRDVAALNARASNGARAELVATQEELPARLRQALVGQTAAVEGVYDPSTGVVWLIAENLASPQRAVEVWAHETLVHHGLRATFDEGERQRLLNDLWLALGGMKHPLIAETARRYGKDPRSDSAARPVIVEEALAKLAEQRGKNLLDAGEQRFWRRVVAAVLRAWHMLVRRVTGRSGSMDAAGMERLLDSLQGYVLDGRGVHKAAFLQEEGALASLADAGLEAAHAAWRQLQADMAAWGRQLDEFAAGRGNRIKPLKVGMTPDVLVQLGAERLPIQIEQRRLRKIQSKHHVPLETLRELPARLADPLMAFKSDTMANAYVILTDMELNGENLVAAIHFDVVDDRIRINDIASIHDRSTTHEGKRIPGWVWVKKQIEKGNLRYYDKTRSPRWFRERAGLQLSSVVNRGDYRGIRILTDKNVVKPVAPAEAALPALADNEKSPARARTHRLQLPKVRRLPAGLSDTTIQAEDSAVKPEGAADEAPLASLRSPDTSWRERVAAAVRGLRNIAGRGVSEDVQALLDNPEQGRLIPREDLGRMERLLKLPHWVAKDHPQFATIYNRQLRRVDERRSAVLAATRRAPLLFDADAGKRLNADEERQLGEMIWKWDGREPDALRDEEKFTVTGTSLNGREELELNPRYQEKFRAWLREQPEPERVKEAFAQVRALLDESFLHAYGRMTQMADLADTDLELFRTEMGNLPNYFPHQRKGKYYVEATATGPDGKRQLVYRQHFDVPLGSSVREEWAKIVAANEKDYPGATWHNPKEVVQLPDDILGAPLDPQAMEQLINTTVQRQIKDGEQAEEVRKALLSGLADVLKSRGFGAHAIQRKNIPGFDRDDIKGILYNYLSGLHGWLSKMDASADFAQALGKISAQKSPELWSFASQYVKDMLRNTDSIDRIAGNIKTAAFVWYLGINIKTAVVNSTQNLIVGVPRLQQEVTGGGALWLKAAMDTLGLRFSGRGIAGAKALKADELRMLEELYGAGVIADAHMDEIRGQIARSPALRMWEKIVRIMGMPMSIVEHFNRASLALAAYRAARAGRLSTSACQRLGVREGERLNHDMARDFADMLVRDTHFEYGKGNAPELLRSTTAGRMLSPAFVFRSYSGNIINLWWRALRHEGREGRVFVAKSLGATVALGGLTAFPFYATLSALCTALSGDDEDWTTKVRRRLPESNLFRDVVCYGLPSLAGVTIGGSLRMETPFTEGIEKGTTFKEIMTQSLVSLIGVPYDLAVNKVSRALEAHSYGADDRALEALVPTFMANIMQARRLATEGQTTLRGRPINSPGQQGARKLDAYEAFGKALGFQPTSSARSYAAYKADKLRSATRSDRIDDFTNLALRDLESNGHAYMLRELRKRLQTWNAEMEEEGKTAMRIMPKEVLRRVTARRRENRPSREQRAKGAAQMALWGV